MPTLGGVWQCKGGVSSVLDQADGRISLQQLILGPRTIYYAQQEVFRSLSVGRNTVNICRPQYSVNQCPLIVYVHICLFE